MLLCLNRRELLFQAITEKSPFFYMRCSGSVFRIWFQNQIALQCVIFVVLKKCLKYRTLSGAKNILQHTVCLFLYHMSERKKKKRKVTDILIGHCIPFTAFIPRANKGKKWIDTCVYCLRNTRELSRWMLQFSVVPAESQSVFPLSSSGGREGKVYCAFKEYIQMLVSLAIIKRTHRLLSLI